MNRQTGKKILFLFLAVVSFAYGLNNFVPDRVVHINGSKSTLPQFVSGIPEQNPKDTESLKIFGILPYKTVDVDVVEKDYVILGGQSIGININVDGIMVLGFSDFYGEDGKKHCPAKTAGLKEKDIVQKINGQKITSASQFSSLVDSCGAEIIDVEYNRDGKMMTTSLTPVKSAEDSLYHLGLWARDGTSGIGTLTFIDPESNTFAALGHPITDAETGDVIKLGSGNIYLSAISDVTKGTRGIAGELEGRFVSTDIGKIIKNTEYGISGEFYGKIPATKTAFVASRNEIEKGNATILCCIEEDAVSEYEIVIENINTSSQNNKSMIIRITDPRLLEKTGGIVQGMSGSPIIQNGRIVGAVTHVFVNDPTRGYGIFIENMLAEAEKIK